MDCCEILMVLIGWNCALSTALLKVYGITVKFNGKEK